MRKKLFYGFSIQCPWPKFEFSGRIIEENQRHVTIAYLGMQNVDEMIEKAKEIKTPFQYAPTGILKGYQFLPENTENVLAYEFFVVSQKDPFQSFVQFLSNEDFLPHVSILRNPNKDEIHSIKLPPLPFYLDGFHLYESLGNSQYQTLYSIRFSPSFEEYEHTADMAYTVVGNTYVDLFHHAQIALSFYYPPFIQCFEFDGHIVSENALVKELNRILTKVDAKFGCPFKAISFHGDIQEEKLLKWEMVVDV